jgi:UDP-glucuronate decarboxylase
VDDLLDGMMALMASDRTFTGPINIGNPGEFTMLELAEKVIALTNSTSKLVHKPLPKDDPRQRKPNIDMAKNVLGWSPKINLVDGLTKTIDYFKSSSVG